MSVMTTQAKINQLAETLEGILFAGGDSETSRPWRFCGVDPMTGCIAYRCDELGITTYCTPGWNREDDDWIVISSSDDRGNLLDDEVAIPFAFDPDPMASALIFRDKVSSHLRQLERAHPVHVDSGTPERMTPAELEVARKIAAWLKSRNARARDLFASQGKRASRHPSLFGRIEGEEAAAEMLLSGAWKRGPG